ncbi:S41 family peptidase [Bacillus sp. FJAT-49736]|uniref:lmo1851 family serine protease n=1 Tax=Bacillus sp. FJAT-49736 TaxID=2833582 RepID=UPI001BC9A114|nr:S41 family peptidase [Bacillus sp. FJAT-49736]MBS4173180.1 PDZ domain-containing protein [Bacillus sp. FJAT-49736]
MYTGMKVVNVLEEEKKNVDSSTEQINGYIRIKKFKFVMLIFVLVFATAGVTTFALAFGDKKAVNVVANNRPEFNKLYAVYDKLEGNYYKDVNKDKLINGAINGMVDALGDPYSDYMSEDEAKQFNESISSSFEGIGAEIQEKDGFIVVVSPIKGSPAEKSGLKPNDKILAVDGKSIRGMSANKAVLLIRGKKGTSVKLTIQPASSKVTTEMTIVRDNIPINTVYAEMMQNGIAKVQITSFSENTYNEFVKALDDMDKKGMKSLIIDLRQNPGGLLDQAIKISNLFVPEGKKIVQTEDRKGKREQEVAESGNKFNIPVAILMDEGSASASEITAAALHESAGIPLIGHKSFGKGTVQTATAFKDGSNIKFTVAKWLTPDGEWIHEKGIQPDFNVDLPKYASLPIINPDKKWKVSDVSSEVKTAEQMLKAIGYNPGKVDGLYDKQTKNAVEKFQKEEHLKVTGTLGGDTTLQLMNKLRDKIISDDPQVKKAVEVLSGK